MGRKKKIIQEIKTTEEIKERPEKGERPEKDAPETLEESLMKQPGPVEQGKKNKIEISSIEIKSLDGKLLLINVGDPTSPASLEDIKEIEDKFVDLITKNNMNCVVFVTHHAVKITVIS
jgi:hypothetical protein